MKAHSIPFSESRNYIVAVISILIAMILDMLPLPQWAFWARPEWLLLVLIYWVMAIPQRINVGFAWCIGILVDVMNGTLLGEHAMAFALVAYTVARLHQRLRMFPLWQQAIAVFMFSIFYQTILFAIQGMIGELPKTLSYWLPSFISMLFWPWTYIILSDSSRNR